MEWSAVFGAWLVASFHSSFISPTLSELSDPCPKNCSCEIHLPGVAVICDGVNLDEVMSDLPPFVYKLGIHKSNIPQLTKTLFRNYPVDSRKYLAILDLSWNDIQSVTRGAVEDFGVLEEVNISANEISVIEINAFSSSSTIKTLDLSNNQLDTQGILGIGKLESLENLNLSCNKISDISCNTVENVTLGTLHRLEIIDNNIEEIDACSFLGSSRISLVNFSSNSIKTISEDTFKNAVRLKSLSLDDNELDIDSLEPISSLSNLETLSLTSNNLLSVPSAIRNLTMLTTLFLSDNPIKAIRVDDLLGLSSLEEFYFRRLPDLTTIEPASLDILPSLKVLAIESNPSLRSIPLDTIPKKNLESITHLMLTFNGVSQFNEGIFKSSPSLGLALIGGNPLLCDCNTKWMKEVIDDPSRYPWASDWAGPKGPVCDSPKSMKKMSIVSIDEEDLTCDRPEVVPLSAEETHVYVGDNVTLQALMYVGIPSGTWFNPMGLPLKAGDKLTLTSNQKSKMKVAIEEERLSNNSVITRAMLMGVTAASGGQYTLVVENASKGTAITFYVYVSLQQRREINSLAMDLLVKQSTSEKGTASEGAPSEGRHDSTNSGATTSFADTIHGKKVFIDSGSQVSIAAIAAIIFAGVVLCLVICLLLKRRRGSRTEYTRLVNKELGPTSRTYLYST